MQTEVKHTPGPWEAVPERLYENRSHVAGRCPHVTHDSKVIAHVQRKDSPPVSGRDPEAEANARLIAQAPRLLADLKALVACFNDEGDFEERHQDQASVALEHAQDAIAKAEGKAS